MNGMKKLRRYLQVRLNFQSMVLVKFLLNFPVSFFTSFSDKRLGVQAQTVAMDFEKVCHIVYYQLFRYLLNLFFKNLIGVPRER